MKLIVGLGNPGLLLQNSRHNIGFRVVKSLAKTFKIPLRKQRNILSLAGRGTIMDERLMLALPLTFMNLSGSAVKALLETNRIRLEDTLVICDDLGLAFGTIRIKPAGSSGGHRGLQSIIDAVASSGFARLRIGIGRPSRKDAGRNYVLSSFTKSEKKQLSALIEEAVDCACAWVGEGIAKSMNIFNRKDLLNENL